MADLVTSVLPVGWHVVRVEATGRVIYAEIEHFPADLPSPDLAARYLAPAMDVVRQCIREGKKHAHGIDP